MPEKKLSQELSSLKVVPQPNQVIFSINDFTAEVCTSLESLETAFKLRYKAYREANAIEKNDERMLYDRYDFMSHTFTHLIWYNEKPIATVRSCIYSDQYDWEPTEGITYFPEDINTKLGSKTRLLESNRYAVAPEFNGRKSLFAQMLMFRIHALCSAAHRCSDIITAVRAKHIPFYRRFLGFEKISETQKKVEWVDAEVVLLAVKRKKSYEIALQRGVPPITPQDIVNYSICIGLYQEGSNLAA